MQFRLRRETPPAVGSRRESTGPLEPEPPLYRSPALRELVARLADDVPHTILDLQPAVGANVEFFSRFTCRLQIVDLLSALAAAGAPAAPAAPAADADAAFRRALPVPAAPYDVVLAWEVLDYLPRERVRGLLEHLCGLCRPRALMLVFISTAKEIPVLPPVFKIADGHTLDWQARATAMRPGPRLAPADVEHMAAGFTVAHSVVMRHGVREYLFERIDDSIPDLR